MPDEYPNEGFVVTVALVPEHPKLDAYPLMTGDLLVRDAAGRWSKEAPGLCVHGFSLTDEQVASLRPVRFARRGLMYSIDDDTHDTQEDR